MTTIRAHCPTCGVVIVTIHQVTVHHIIDLNRYRYTLTCDCGLATDRYCEPHIARLLDQHGCEVVTITLPAEMFELHDGDPLTDADLERFVAELEQWEGAA